MPNPHHGSGAFHRGMNAPHSRYFASGKFGRLFPTLSPLFHRDKTEGQLRTALLDLGAPGGPMAPSGSNPNNPDIPLGFGFFGQFVDHDITLDTTSSFERQNDPEGISNFRTPALELDNVYGSGPSVDPWLYASGGVRLLVEPEFGRDQIPRAPVSRTALIGDPRNDENLIISQLQLVFLKAHNGIVDALQSNGVAPDHLFAEAQRILRWHYQWTVLHEFLPLTVGQELVDDIYNVCEGGGRRFYNWRYEPFIPVEFSVAAYRFGHTQIPARIKVNDEFVVNGNDRIVLFDRDEVGDSDPDDLSGFGLRAQRRYVEWENLFDTPGGSPQPTKRIDTILSGPLFDLPFVTAGDPGRSGLARRPKPPAGPRLRPPLGPGRRLLDVHRASGARGHLRGGRHRLRHGDAAVVLHPERGRGRRGREAPRARRRADRGRGADRVAGGRPDVVRPRQPEVEAGG